MLEFQNELKCLFFQSRLSTHISRLNNILIFHPELTTERRCSKINQLSSIVAEVSVNFHPRHVSPSPSCLPSIPQRSPIQSLFQDNEYFLRVWYSSLEDLIIFSRFLRLIIFQEFFLLKQDTVRL